MTGSIAFVFALTAVAVMLLATERQPADLVAMAVAAVLLAAGVLTPDEAFAGFANPAIVAVGAMFVLSAGLANTGVVDGLGDLLHHVAKRGLQLALAVMMIGVGIVSAFLNNTAAVAILIPTVLGLARRAGASPSRLLMPLSFASMFGGVCTLIGTSTNLLASGIAQERGYAPFGMFEFSLLGIAFFAAGTLYMLVVGRRLVPDHRADGDLTASFGLGHYLTDVTLRAGAASVGRSIGEAPLLAGTDIEVLQVIRDGQRLAIPSPDFVLREGDVLRLLCEVDEVVRLRERDGIVLTAADVQDRDLEAGDARLVEVVVPPNSPFVGRTLAEVHLRESFGATALAIRRRHGEIMRGHVRQVPLRAGDALLLEARADQLSHLQERNAMLVVSQPRRRTVRRTRMAVGIGIMVAVVVVAATGLLPIAGAAVLGAILMVLVGCLTPAEAYDAIQWRVLFLIAGMLALGVAMQKTGAALLLTDFVLAKVRWLGPTAILSALYVFTSLLTEVMSNNAAVALLVPIAIGTAETLGLDPRPFLVAVVFASSSSFMTPIGYQTNTMIYGPGRYRFGDFVRVGAPLNVLFWALATFLIPKLWPFE